MDEFVLIETLWNVKLYDRHFPYHRPSVLIETLWNVKTEGEAIRRASRMVLIETLWNVKFALSPVSINACPY